MILFFFNNMYIHGIHNGIQAGHAAVRLIRKYQKAALSDANVFPLLHQVEKWADNHETFIILNAGDSDSMRMFRCLMESENNPYPFCDFYEPGLSNTLTSLAILLPERMYNEQAKLVGRQYYAERPEGFSAWDEQFLIEKAKCSLAN